MASRMKHDDTQLTRMARTVREVIVDWITTHDGVRKANRIRIGVRMPSIARGNHRIAEGIQADCPRSTSTTTGRSSSNLGA